MYYSSSCDSLVCNETINGMVCECVRNPVDPVVCVAIGVLLVIFGVVLFCMVAGVPRG